jgi:hypothetical protein
MKKRLVALLSLAFVLGSCSHLHSPSPGNSAYGHCQAHKHSCAKYEKELRKKSPHSGKIASYRQDCAEYNRHCR